MKVPFIMTKTDSDIDKFDIDNPEFDWIETPAENQMTVDLLLKNLDQTLTSDSSEITPPRGLSSVNYLGLKAAKYHSVSGKYTVINITCEVPDFDFLPLGITSKNNKGKIVYTRTE